MTTESPHLHLPQSISGIVDGELPEAKIKKVYVHNPVKCRQVEVLVSVRDMFFRDSKGRRVGYWYNNDSMSGLLEISVELVHEGSIYTSKMLCTKENCIDPLDDNVQLGGRQKKRTFHFLLKLENDQDKDFPHSLEALVGTRGDVDLMHVNISIPSPLVREKYENSSYDHSMTGKTDSYNGSELNSKVLFYQDISVDRLTHYEVAPPSVTSALDYKNSVRRFSDLWLSTKPSGDIAGTFLLNIESLIRRDSNYSLLLNSMTQDKRRDLINELITEHENELLNSIKITRTRVKNNSNEDVNSSTHFEEGKSEEVIIRTNKTNDIDGPKSSFTKSILRLSESNAPNFRTFSFLDKTAKNYRGATFKYKVSIDSQVDNYMDKILREKYQLFGESVSRMEHYESLFYTNKYLIEGTEFYDLTNKETDVTTTYRSHKDTIKTDLATIVDFMMIFNKQAQDSSLETLEDVYENMNPLENPSIRVLTTLNDAISEVKSKIDSYLFTPTSLGSITSTGFNIDISDKKYPPNQIEKEFFARADINKTFQGVQYLPHEGDGDVFPVISKNNFITKNNADRESYKSGVSLLPNTFENRNSGQSHTEDPYSYGIPDTFISEGSIHSIDDLPVLSSSDLSSELENSATSPAITKLPNLVLELHTKKKNIKTFYHEIKNFILEGSSVKMTIPYSSTMSESVSEENRNRSISQVEELKFYINLFKRKIFSNNYTKNPIQSAELVEMESTTQDSSFSSLFPSSSRNLQGNPFQQASVRDTGNQITNLKGEVVELDNSTTDFLNSVPWYFRSFFTGAQSEAQKISNTFDSGYGMFVYLLTYQKVAKFEFLRNVDDAGNENWIPLTSQEVENSSGEKILCRISSINDSTLGFQTDESTLVINRYFILG